MKISNLLNATGRTRILALLITLLMTFAVTACGDDDDNGGNDPVVDAGADAGNGTPDGGNGTPDGGNGTPDGGNGTPDGGNGTPDGGNGTPDGGNGTPDGGNGTPDGGNGTPDGGNGTPDGGNGTPDGGNGDTCTPLPGEAGTCSILCQTGCTTGGPCGVGEDQDGNVGIGCFPASAVGTATQGEACDPQNDVYCAIGYGCFGGECLGFCDLASGEGCDEGASCVYQPGVAPGQTNPYPEGLGLCGVLEDECEPFPAENTCGEGQNCYAVQGPDGNPLNICSNYSETAQPGSDCDGIVGSCGDLQICIPKEGTSQNPDGTIDGTCALKCNENDLENFGCAEGEFCATPDGSDFGICLPE